MSIGATKTPPSLTEPEDRRLQARPSGRRFREALAILPRLVHAAASLIPRRAVAGPGTAPRILLQAYSWHLAQFFRPLLEELRRRSPDLEMWLGIVPHPFFPSDSRAELRHRARRELGIDEARIASWPRLSGLPVDLVLCSDVFARLPRSGSSTCLLFHGAGLGDRVVERGPFRRTAFDFDLVLVNGDFDRRRLDRARRQMGVPTRIETVGFPYLDALRAPPIERRDYLRGLGLDPARPTILFGPGWGGLAALPDRGRAYLEETIAALAGVEANVVVKPHACTLNVTMAGGVSWAGRLRGDPDRRVAFDLDPDDVPSLAHCDVLLTDRSSRTINVRSLGKPVVSWDPSPPPPGLWDRERFDLLRGVSLVAADPVEAARLCRMAIDDPDIGSCGSDGARDALAYPGHASATAAAVLLEWISHASVPAGRDLRAARG